MFSVTEGHSREGRKGCTGVSNVANGLCQDLLPTETAKLICIQI
jgi:hypothetical protein